MVFKVVVPLAVSGTAAYIYATALHEVFLRDRASIIATSYGGHLQFLTILALVASLAQQVVAVLAQLTRLRTLNALQNWLLMLTAPLEVVVAALYWPLKFYNNDLVKDPRFGLRIDPRLDRKCHLYPALFQLVAATVFSQRRWRPRNIVALGLFGGVAAAYWRWVEHTNEMNGFYPYPLLRFLDDRQKGALVSGAAVVAFITFKLIQAVQRRTSRV